MSDNPSHDERIEQIRKTLADWENGITFQYISATTYAADVIWLMDENAKLQRMVKTRENKVNHLREQLSSNKLRRRLEKQGQSVRQQGQRIEGLKWENERLRFQVEMDEALWRGLYEGASGLWGGGHVKPHALLNAERCRAALQDLGPHDTSYFAQAQPEREELNEDR